MKRIADEAITKEHGSTPNTEAVQSSSKQMATAAQRASRKIAPLRKSRVGQGSRATTPTGPSVFDQPQQPSFSVPSATFQFGSNTASSFPPPSQPSFNFGDPNPSSSFTFGGSTQPQNNPFASMNGNVGGATQHDNTMMEDSPQKPAPVFSSSLFPFGNNNSNPQNNASTNGFNFGQSTQEQKTTGGFGKDLFGQQKQSQEPMPKVNLFAPISQPAQQNGISSTTGLFGQNTQPSTSAPSSAPLFTGFGTSLTSTPVSAPKTEPLFKFGETSAPQTTSTQPEQSQSFTGFNFGKPSSELQPTTSKPLFSLGQPSAPAPVPDVPASSQQPDTSHFPSHMPNSTSSSSSNLFSPAVKTVGEQSENASNEGATEDQQTGPKNPFASLFSAKPVRAPSDQAVKPSSSAFKFGEATTFAPSQKSSESTSTATEPTPANPPKSPFNFGQSSNSSGGFFSPKASSSSQAMPNNNLFNLNKASPSAETDAQDKSTGPIQASAPTPSTSFLNSFAQPKQIPPAEPPEASSNTNSNPFGVFGQQTAPSLSREPEPTSAGEGSSPKKRALFHASTPAAMAQTAFGAFQTNTSIPNEPKSYKAPTQQEVPITKEPISRAVSTEGAPQIPRHLSGDKYKSYDENYRLRNLNRLFKDKIADIDVNKFDIISLIQNYLDHRESIGEGLGRYGRVKAGLKRKAADVDDLGNENDSQGKKSRVSTTAQPPQPATEASSKTTLPSNTSNPSSLFSSVTSPKSNNVFSPSKPASDPQTSSLFRSMIPSASNSATNPPSVFSTAITKSTTPPSSPPKTSAPQMPKFEMPKFNTGGDFMAAFAKSSAENAKKFEEAARDKRKAEEFDSEDDDEEAWTKQYEEEQRAKRAKIDAAAKGSFVPKFGTTTTSQPTSSFGQSSTAATTTKPTQAFGAPSPDVRGSSQEPVATIESGVDSDENEVSGSGNSGDDEEEPVTDDLAEDEVEEDNQDEDANEEMEEEGEPIPQLSPSQSLFGRITRDKPKESVTKQDQPIMQPTVNNSFKPGIMFGNIGKSTPDAPGFSPLTPGANSIPKGDFVPTTTFNYTPTANSVSAKSWNTSSVLTGGAVRDGPIPGEGLFGSRPSTPQPLGENDSKSTSLFGMPKSTPSDNTWKRGSEIKFGTSPSKTDNAAPVVEVTSATPPPKDQSKPFAGLFGQSVDKTSSTNGNSNSLGFNFGNGLHSSASNTPVPGFLSAALHIGNSTPGSGISSRATSPGLTDNESVATDNTDDYSNEPQAPSLMNTNAGEEDEEIIFENRSHIYRHYSEKDLVELDMNKEKGIGRGREKMTAGLNQKGTGTVKLLKHKETKKCRIVFRADPGANIILNVRLLPSAKYTSISMGKTNGAVQFPAVGEDGKMQSWMVKLKTKELSDKMVKLANENKDN